MIGLPIAIISAIVSHKNAKTYKETVWWPLYQEWQASFLCERCGIAFRPIESD